MEEETHITFLFGKLRETKMGKGKDFVGIGHGFE
jgi:hypothetical protein